METINEDRENFRVVESLRKIAESYKTSPKKKDYESLALSVIKESNYPKKEYLIDYWSGLIREF